MRRYMITCMVCFRQFSIRSMVTDIDLSNNVPMPICIHCFSLLDPTKYIGRIAAMIEYSHKIFLQIDHCEVCKIDTTIVQKHIGGNVENYVKENDN